MNAKKLGKLLAIVALNLVVNVEAADIAKTATQTGTNISGIVRDFQTKKPLKHSQVGITNLDSHEDQTVFTDADGKYRLSNVKDGRYRISAYWKDSHYGIYHGITVKKQLPSLVLDFALAELKKGRLFGVVHDGNGNHIPNTKLHIKRFPKLQASSDKSGAYVVDDLPSTARTVTAIKDGFIHDEYYLQDHGFAAGMSYYDQKPFSIRLVKQAPAVTIGPEGGVIKKEDGTEITIPKGALKKKTAISITIVPTKFTELNEEGIPCPNPVSQMDFEPSGLVFKKPIQVRTPCLLPAKLMKPEADGKEGPLQFCDTETGRVETVKARYHKADHTMTFNLDHF